MSRELHVISNGKLPFAQLLQMIAGILNEVDYLHIREREKSTRELYEGVNLLIEGGVCPSKLIINDRIDIALLTDIPRVQLGYKSADMQAVKKKFPSLHVGCSVHSLEEALQAQEKGADSVMYGHLFSTLCKEGVPPRGLQEITEITSKLTIPVTAIGGITPQNVVQVLETGATGIAVMSGIIGAADPIKKAKQYRETMQRWENHE